MEHTGSRHGRAPHPSARGKHGSLDAVFGCFGISYRVLPDGVFGGQADCARPVARRNGGRFVLEKDAVFDVAASDNGTQGSATVEATVDLAGSVATQGTRC